MGFHLSNLFCRFKRTVFGCFFFSKFPESPQKLENHLCDIEVYYTVSITILGHWRRGPKQELRYIYIYICFFLFFFEVKPTSSSNT